MVEADLEFMFPWNESGLYKVTEPME